MTKTLLLSASLLGAAGAQAALTDNLFAYYTFNNGTAANMSAGAGGAASLTAGVTYVSGGLTAGGQSVDINTGSNFVSVASATNVALGNNLTISAWLKLDSTSTTRSYAWETSNNFNISLGSSGGFDGTNPSNSASYLPYLNQGSSSSFSVANPTTSWFLLTQTIAYDGSSTLMTTYLNGVSVRTQSVTGTIAAFSGINFGGARTSATGRSMDGQMDDIGLWTRALDSSEVLSIYNLGIAGSSAVPEPSTYGLLGAGALAAAAFVRRRRKAV